MNKNTAFQLFAIQRPMLILVVAVLVVFLYACGENATPTPELPQGAVACSGDGGSYKCDGQSGHQISLSNVPQNAKPYLLPISPDDEDRLRKAERKGTNCIISIVGDLAFYDEKNHLVTEFDPPVSISYQYLEEADKSSFDQCISDFPETKDYVPVAFYDHKEWRPVEPYTKADDGTVSFEFTTWGDQQGGFGTKP